MNSTIIIILGAGVLSIIIYSLKKQKTECLESNDDSCIGTKKRSVNTDKCKLYPQKDEEEIAFVTTLMRNVADNISTFVNVAPDQLQQNLIEWWSEKEKGDRLDKVHSIECSFTKRSPSMMQTIVTVALVQDKEMIMRNIEEDIEWEYLPKDLRSEFIKNGGNHRCYILCETNTKI